MSYLSIDPEGYPGTQEAQEWEEEHARRAWLQRISYMEEVDFDNLIFPDRWTAIAPSTGAFLWFVL